MGLKITNYKIDGYGITLENAYAQLTNITVNVNGKVNCSFDIQQTREDIATKHPLERKMFSCEIDKDLPLYKQVYEKAKEEVFPGWQDDIV